VVVASGSPLIRRDGLIARLSHAAPRILAAIAPAGYGKSTVMRAFAATFPSSSICDCGSVESAAALARELLIAVAHGDQERTAALAQQQIAASADERAWFEFAEQSWSSDGGPELLVFENVEHILDSVENVAFLARILARMPRSRRAGICSRRPLPISLSRFAPPHEVVTLRAQDLRFDEHEIRAVFPNGALEPETLVQIAELTRGWPIAVLLFARLARERKVSALFDDLNAVAFDSLYEYLAEQVLSTLSAAELQQLITIAAIPKATANEVAIATGDPSAAESVAAFARSSPLLYSVADGSFEVHPIVVKMLRNRYADECTSALTYTADHLRAIDQFRAAQLYLHAGNQDAAASMLENGTGLWFADPPPTFAEIVSQIDTKVLLRYPAVWSGATKVRATLIPHRQWLHEALIVRDNLSEDSPIEVQMDVVASLANVLTNLGRHDEAIDAVERFATAHAGLPVVALAVIDLVKAAIYARRGALVQALETWARAEPVFAQVKFTRAIVTEEVEVRAARYRGDRNAERSLCDLSVSLARESENALALALTLEEAAFAAWFAGEERLFERYVGELEQSAAPTTRKATEVFRASARGQFEPLFQSEQIEHPKIRCYAALIACGGGVPELRAEAAKVALLAAKEAAEPALVAISCIACAECNPSERDSILKEASAAASAVDYGVLERDMEAYARGGGGGIYAPLLERLRSKTVPIVAGREPEYCVFVRTGRLYRGNEEVNLSGRELELLVFLASRNRPCTSDEIIEALWPDRSVDDTTVLRVSINRTRARLDDPEIILSGGGTYRLGTHVTSDLAEMESALRIGRQMWPLGSTGRRDLERCFDCFCLLTPTEPPWPWFAPCSVRVNELSREIAALLGRDALAADKPLRARHFAQRIVEQDPCDEPARELLIRSYLAEGDRSAAVREFRIYKKTLADELGAEPSSQLAQLVAET
jgi:DNA-binding SARP family transcriptional activator/tetratricopeptide (TPR) repeat protein